ncbi:hypothetical protein [uncultured Sphingomonas sp.]|uniref:hypothetical protein n=1 Tax=uncultured Sphingomonas sp. TaxID=158754 RepID=UPI0035CB9D5B
MLYRTKRLDRRVGDNRQSNTQSFGADLKIKPLIHGVTEQGQHGYDQSTAIIRVGSTPDVAQRLDILDVS